MPRGRPTKSSIRQNMVEVLAVTKEAYGYDLYKMYIRMFPRITMRSIYYHLKKGVALGEFMVSRVEKSKGEYSWGPEAEKTYYSLGPQAKPLGSDRVREFFAQKVQG